MAIALSKEKVQVQTGLTILYSFVVLLLANTLVLLLANLFFPTHVVLGTFSLSPIWSLYLATTQLTVVTTFMIPLVYYHEWKRSKQYSDKEWMLVYFLANVILVWILARFADKLGFGISSWFVALVLGFALDLVQGIGIMTLGKYNKMK